MTIDMARRYARLLEDNRLSKSDETALAADLRTLADKMESFRKAHAILAKYGMLYRGDCAWMSENEKNK